MSGIKEIKANTFIGDYGQMAQSFELTVGGEEDSKIEKCDFVIENHFKDLTGKTESKGITAVSAKPTEEGVRIVLEVEPFIWRYDFKVSGTAGEIPIACTK